MLRIYWVILETLRMLREVLRRIERYDRDLARQLRKASSSMALNVAEGMYSRGRNRAVRYHTALGSARESWSCLEVAVAHGYLEEADPRLVARFRQIVGTLVRLVQRHG